MFEYEAQQARHVADERTPRLEFAGVTAVSTDQRKVTVTFDGDIANTLEIVKTNSFTPVVGESCVVLIQGQRMIAIGSVSSLSEIDSYKVTAATRPSSPVNGTHIFETDTQKDMWYDGSVWRQSSPFAVSAGQSTFTLSPAAVTKTVSVTFPAGVFSQAPIVTTGVHGTSAWFANTWVAPTTSGFTAVVSFRDGGSTGSTLTTYISWMAVQMTAASGSG